LVIPDALTDQFTPVIPVELATGTLAPIKRKKEITAVSVK